MSQVIHRMQIALWALTGFVLIAMGQTALCQEPGPPPPGPMGAPPSMNVDKQLSKMTKRYGLSDAQKAQIRPSWLKRRRRWMPYSRIRPFLRKIDSTKCASFMRMKLLGSHRSCPMSSERNTRRTRSGWAGRTAISCRMVHLLRRLMIRAVAHLQATDLFASANKH